MKMMKFFLLAAAAVAAISCVKEDLPIENENPTPEVELVPMTFTASYAEADSETKVAYENGATVWQLGDKIMVISSTGTATEFKATEVTNGGKSATFEGLTENADEYYAVYPASAYKGTPEYVTDAAGGKLVVEVPQVQQAVAGTFHPSAILCIANTKGTDFMFKHSCAFLKFNIAAPEGVKSVRLKVNGSDNVAGIGYVGVNATDMNPKYASSDANMSAYDMITLNAPEGGFEVGEDYFIAMRANSCPNGITAYIEYEDKVMSRTSTKQVFTPVKDEAGNVIMSGSIGKIKNLGQLDKNLSEVTPYDAYTLGLDIMVAGKAINKATYGDATLVTKTQGIDKSGVYFVNSDATANFNSGITGNLILIGNTPGTRSNVSRSGVSYLTASDSDDALIMQNVKYVECTANVFQLNAAKPFETIIFDNCLLNVASGKYFILSNSAANTITDFTMSNCDVKMDGNVSLVKMGGSTINSITFENNVLYADAEMTSFLAVNSTAKVESVVFNSNTLYNTTIGTTTTNEDAIVKANNITDFVAKNNYVVYSNSTANRYFGRATFVGGEVDNNFYVRKTSTTTAIYGVPGTKPTWVTTQPAVKAAPDNLTTNWDPENGKYILGGYNGVGATR